MYCIRPNRPNHFFDDVVNLILESDDNWWPRDLGRLSRVSRSWLYPTRKRLYSYPSLYSFTSCYQLSQTLAANPHLRSLVRGIELKPMCGDDQRVTANDLAAVRFLLSLEGLQKLSLGGGLAIEAERFIRALANSESITELSIDGGFFADKFDSPASLKWDEFAAFRFPNLHSLRLSHLSLDIEYSSTPPPFSLRDLTLDGVMVVGGSPIHLIQPSRLPSLNITMGDDGDWTPNQIKSILEHCVVECFRLEAQWQSFFDADLPPCPSMQCLMLDDVFLDYDGLVSIAEHCPHLIRLDVRGRVVRVTPCQWARFITSGALSQLQYLDLPWCTYEPPSVTPWNDADALEIGKASASRSIDVSSLTHFA